MNRTELDDIDLSAVMAVIDEALEEFDLQAEMDDLTAAFNDSEKAAAILGKLDGR
jgi:hypothetical protein